MKRNSLFIHWAAVLPMLLSAAGCADDGMPDAGPVATPLSVRLHAVTPEGSEDSDAESSIRSVTGYRFEGGVLREVIPGIPSGHGDLYTFPSAAPRGELRLAVNAAGVGSFGTLVPEATSLETFLRLDATPDELTHDGFVMTGTLLLDGAGLSTAPRSVNLRRSVARIDLLSRDAEVEVHSVTIRRIADRGYVAENGAPATPSSASRTDFRRDYGDAPLVMSRETLLCLCEQPNDGMEVEVVTRFDGGWHRLKNTLPAQLLRNTVYTLEVRGRGADAGVTVTAGSWEEGSTAESAPILRGVVDAGASELPDGVRLNAACDTVYIPHVAGALRLVLRAEAGSEVIVDGEVRGVRVTPERVTRGLETVAAVSVTTPLRMPGTKDEYIGLTLARDGVMSGRVTLVFAANPVRIEGLLQLDETGACDFGRYIEGELARISAPEGVELRLEFASGEPRWMALVPDGDAFRLLGGWKPNDPQADGRVQEGFLVIADAGGSAVERYAVRRRNWGLPVVNIGGTWWCKYNLRGDVSRYEDQVLIADDPAGDADLADYLIAADDADLLALLGDQYQAGNPQGLPLRHDGSAFYHEGMASSGQNFGVLDPTAMAPCGYQVPDYDDYAFFTWSENYNLGGVGERTFRNATGEELTIRIQERETEFFGHAYGTIAVYEFRSGNSVWVLAGLGHQWTPAAGNIARMSLLLATYGNASKTWMMEGYANADRPGQNWFKFVANNSTKTRVLRCVKTPVEYIYGE